MGAYISVDTCASQYNVTINCTVSFNNATQEFQTLGDVSPGTFQLDPDVAGIGVLGVFMAVTSLALAICIVNVGWQTFKILGWWKSKHTERQSKDETSAAEIMETLILACSDQQVFTGAAYALTLRYEKGCEISAYHYNIVANMMLLTCATHLMSVTVVRNYWRFPWLALLRVICISGVFIVTGLLLSNQDAQGQTRFPTTLPPMNTSSSLMFLPAACFQSSEGSLTDTLQESTQSANAFFVNSILNTTPSNKIQGWNFYLIMLLFYGAALIAEFIRFCRRGQSRPGWRAKVGNKFKRYCGLGTKSRRLAEFIFLFYLIAGIGISCTTVIFSGQFIFALRRWVDQSQWWDKIADNGRNSENDATSFGQLVPIITSGLIVFSFAQTISEKLTERGDAEGEKPLGQQRIKYLDPSIFSLNIGNGYEDTAYHGAQSLGTPGTLDPHQTPALAQGAPCVLEGTVNTSSPLLGGNGSSAGTPGISGGAGYFTPLAPRTNGRVTSVQRPANAGYTAVAQDPASPPLQGQDSTPSLLPQMAFAPLISNTDDPFQTPSPEIHQGSFSSSSEPTTAAAQPPAKPSQPH